MDKPIDFMPDDKTVEYQDLRVVIVVRLKRCQGKMAVIDDIQLRGVELTGRWWA